MIKLAGFLVLIASCFCGAFFVFAKATEGEFFCLKVKENPLEVEVACSFKKRAEGLKRRKSLEENRGMLFVFEKSQILSFWMKDTWIPLSIAFIDEKGVIRSIRDMTPESLFPVRSNVPCLYALEVNKGWFTKRGIIPGDSVILPKRSPNRP